MSLDGKIVDRWSTSGDGPGEIDWGHGIAVGHDGSVYVDQPEGSRRAEIPEDEVRRRAFGLALTVTVVASAGAAPSWAQTTGDISGATWRGGHVALYGIFTASPQDRALATIHVAAQVAAGVRLNSWLLATTDVTSAWTTFRSRARRGARRSASGIRS